MRRILSVIALVLALGACTPEQMAAWMQANDIEVPEDEQELAEAAAWAEEWWTMFIELLIEHHEAQTAAQPAPAPASGYGWPWDQLVQCEATGNWHINTGNGYYGGLQFSHGTWVAYGGQQYAAYAHQAAPWQQIAIAQKVVNASGGTYGAWPGCRAALGLP